MQYSFSNNPIVDAIIKVGEYILPIDAKFSLDNYNKMIDEEIDNEKLNDLEKKFKSDIKKISFFQNISGLTKEQLTMLICLYC